MRILQVVRLASPDGTSGGTIQVALNQSAELIRRGHQVTVVAATRGYDVVPDELDGVPVTLFPARTLVPATGFAGMGSPALSRWFRANWTRFDIVHIHFARDLVVLPLALAARRRRLPCVLQPHGQVVPSTHPFAAPLDAMCTRKLLRAAEAIFYLTPKEHDQLVAVGGPDLRLTQLGNGVPEYPSAVPPAGPPEVLFAARMHPRKRPIAFVEMAKALLEAGVDARFTLVGPDDGEGVALRAAIQGQSRITWEGALCPGTVPKRMASASVYVLPSVREPYPMAVLEAMSVGLPVVISADCGLAQLVERARCGVVVEPEVPALAAAVGSILADPPLASAMSGRAREAVRAEVCMDQIGDQLVDTYTRVAGGVR
ncbi:glycosyltransferase [Mycobacterium sp. URHB0021]|jgi:glycosyltransferase involved in cell wall biosynthesis